MTTSSTYPYRIPSVLKHIFITFVFTVLLVLCCLIATMGQQAPATPPAPAPAPPAATYTPTEIQSLKLKLAQANAKVAQKDLQATQQAAQNAQAAFQQSVTALQTACDDVRKEQKWPETVQCNLDTLVFFDKPAATPPAPAPAPPAPASPPVAPVPTSKGAK